MDLVADPLQDTTLGLQCRVKGKISHPFKKHILRTMLRRKLYHYGGHLPDINPRHEAALMFSRGTRGFWWAEDHVTRWQKIISLKSNSI